MLHPRVFKSGKLQTIKSNRGMHICMSLTQGKHKLRSTLSRMRVYVQGKWRCSTTLFLSNSISHVFYDKRWQLFVEKAE